MINDFILFFNISFKMKISGLLKCICLFFFLIYVEKNVDCGDIKTFMA